MSDFDDTLLILILPQEQAALLGIIADSIGKPIQEVAECIFGQIMKEVISRAHQNKNTPGEEIYVLTSQIEVRRGNTDSGIRIDANPAWINSLRQASAMFICQNAPHSSHTAVAIRLMISATPRYQEWCRT